jgi:glutamate/tyrosine decarboxylase-like PLP-dependent enzyme
MSLRDLPLEFFLERIADMPDLEAVQEIDARLVCFHERRLELTHCDGDVEAKNAERQAMNAEELRLRAERHLIVMRMDRRRWSKAVRALWGEEGLEQALIWLETVGDPEVSQIPLNPKVRQ